MIDKEEIFHAILEAIGIGEEKKLEDEFNIFNYDSFTKVNMIVVMETFAENEDLSIDALVNCDTYQDLIDLTQKMYDEVH